MYIRMPGRARGDIDVEAPVRARGREVAHTRRGGRTGAHVEGHPRTIAITAEEITS
jgi:hypothetical protein